MNNEDGHPNDNGGVPIYGRRPTFNGNLADRLPPRHLEAERACLGSMLLDNATIEPVLKIVRPDHFYRDSHQLACRRIAHLHALGKPVDAVTLADDMETVGVWENFGKDDALEEIIRSVPHAANATYYAGIVLEKAVARLQIELGADLVRRAYNGQETSDELLDAAATMIESLRPNGDGDDDEPGFTPLPTKMDAKAFYGIAGEVVRTIAPHTEGCPEGILGQFLVAFAHVFGPRPRWELEATEHRCNLYLCLVGPTGIARKGTSWDVTAWLLNRCDEQWSQRRIASGLTSGEGLIALCKETGGPLLAVETEFARLLTNMGRENNSLSSVCRQAWDGPRLEVPTKNHPIRCDGSYFSLIGHTTHPDLKAKLRRNEVDNGFVGRVMFANVYRAQCLPEGGDFQSVANALGPLIRDLALAIDFARKDRRLERPMRKTPRAVECWNELYKGPFNEPRTGDYAKVTVRGAPITLRLAVILAVLDRCASIDAPHIEAAKAFWDYCDQTAESLFGGGPIDRDGAKVLELLRSTEAARMHGLTRSEIGRRVFAGHRRPDEVDLILSVLNEAGLIRHEAARKGRACSVWKATSIH